MDSIDTMMSIQLDVEQHSNNSVNIADNIPTTPLILISSDSNVSTVTTDTAPTAQSAAVTSMEREQQPSAATFTSDERNDDDNDDDELIILIHDVDDEDVNGDDEEDDENVPDEDDGDLEEIADETEDRNAGERLLIAANAETGVIVVPRGTEAAKIRSSGLSLLVTSMAAQTMTGNTSSSSSSTTAAAKGATAASAAATTTRLSPLSGRDSISSGTTPTTTTAAASMPSNLSSPDCAAVRSALLSQQATLSRLSNEMVSIAKMLGTVSANNVATAAAVGLTSSTAGPTSSTSKTRTGSSPKSHSSSSRQQHQLVSNVGSRSPPKYEQRATGGGHQTASKWTTSGRSGGMRTQTPVIAGFVMPQQQQQQSKDASGPDSGPITGWPATKTAVQYTESLRRRTEAMTQKCLRLQKESLNKANELKDISERLTKLQMEEAVEQQYQLHLANEYKRVKGVACRAVTIMRKVNMANSLLEMTREKLAVVGGGGGKTNDHVTKMASRPSAPEESAGATAAAEDDSDRLHAKVHELVRMTESLLTTSGDDLADVIKHDDSALASSLPVSKQTPVGTTTSMAANRRADGDDAGGQWDVPVNRAGHSWVAAEIELD